MGSVFGFVRICAVAAGMLPAASVCAQPLGFVLGVPDAPAIRTVDQDQLYFESRFGQRVQNQIAAASQALEAENQRLVAELSSREMELTERRADLSPAEFRELADAFNARAEAVRNEQERKSREIVLFQEAEQLRFFEAAGPLLNTLLAEVGGSVLVDARFVLIAADEVDLTDLAIARINDVLGDGADEPARSLPQTDPGSGTAPSVAPPADDMAPPLELPGPGAQP